MISKKCKFLVIILCVLFVMQATPAHAGLPTFDVPKVLGDVIKSVSNFAKKVGEKIKDVQNQLMGKLTGKIKEAREFGENAKAKAEAETGNLKSAIDEGKKAKEDIEKEKAKVDKVVNDNKIYMEYSAAKTQVSSIKGNYEQSVKAQEENSSAKISSIDQNIETLKKETAVEGVTDERKTQIEDTIVQQELSKKSIEDENQKNLLTLAEERDAALTPAEAEVARIEKELKDKGMSLAEGELAKSIDMSSPTAALDQVTKKAFVKEANTETVVEAKKWLRKDYAQEKIAALSDALRSVEEISEQKKEVSDPEQGVSTGVHLVEGFSAAVTVSNDVKIEQAKALLNYNRQLINKLKLATAQQLSDANVETVNSDQNLSTFSLDDYNYSVQCKGVK